MRDRNTFGQCGDCRKYRDMFCMNTAAPWGGKPRMPMHGCYAFITGASLRAIAGEGE